MPAATTSAASGRASGPSAVGTVGLCQHPVKWDSLDRVRAFRLPSIAGLKETGMAYSAAAPPTPAERQTEASSRVCMNAQKNPASTGQQWVTSAVVVSNSVSA